MPVLPLSRRPAAVLLALLLLMLAGTSAVFLATRGDGPTVDVLGENGGSVVGPRPALSLAEQNGACGAPGARVVEVGPEAVSFLAFNASHTRSFTFVDAFPSLAVGKERGVVGPNDELLVQFVADAPVDMPGVTECARFVLASYARNASDASRWDLFDFSTVLVPLGEVVSTPRVRLADCDIGVVFAVGGRVLDPVTSTQSYGNRTIDAVWGLAPDQCGLEDVCTDVTLSALGGERVRVEWEDVGAESYYVWRATAGSSAFRLVAQVRGTSFVDDGVQAGTTYRYVVEPMQHEPPLSCPGAEVTAVPFFGGALPFVVALGGALVALVALRHTRK